MEPKIYKSDFRISPDSTKKQQMLFAADTAFALSEGYTYIQELGGTLFFIQDANNLIEVDSVDELVQEPAEVELDPTESEEEEYVQETFISDYFLPEYPSEYGFFEDVKRCFDSGINIIEDAEGYGFTINSATSVTRLYGPTDEEVNEAPELLDNQAAIAKIINNTLNQEAPLRLDQIAAIEKLGSLYYSLEGIE